MEKHIANLETSDNKDEKYMSPLMFSAFCLIIVSVVVSIMVGIGKINFFDLTAIQIFCGGYTVGLSVLAVTIFAYAKKGEKLLATIMILFCIVLFVLLRLQ